MRILVYEKEAEEELLASAHYTVCPACAVAEPAALPGIQGD